MKEREDGEESKLLLASYQHSRKCAAQSGKSNSGMSEPGYGQTDSHTGPVPTRRNWGDALVWTADNSTKTAISVHNSQCSVIRREALEKRMHTLTISFYVTLFKRQFTDILHPYLTQALPRSSKVHHD